MKIDNVTIQGMHKIDGCKTYLLKDLIYLFGKNGAGKSTVMQAIQLAVLGYIPGTDKTKTAIFNHANGNKMEVTVIFDNGTGIIRSWEKSGSTINASVESIGGLDTELLMDDVGLPIFDFSEFIGLSANKLKDWFVNFFPTNNYSVDWNTELSNAALQLNADSNVISDIAAHITEDYGTDINSVRKFNEECKTIISSKKGELARVQSTIQSLIHYDDCDPTLNADTIKADISTAEIVVDELKAKLTKYEQYEKAKATIADVQDIINQADSYENHPTVIQAKQRLSELQQRSDQITESSRQNNSKLRELESDVKAKTSVVNANGLCPYTKDTCDSIIQVIEQYKQDIESLNKSISELQANFKRYDNEFKEVENEVISVATTGNNIESAYTKYNSVKSLIDPSFDSISKDSILQELNTKNTELASLREKLVQVQANAKYETLMETLTADKIQIELDLELYKAWEKLTSINGLQTKLMNQPFADFSTKMTKYIQKFYDREDISAGFCLVEKANSFSFGLIRDGKYIPYDLLSSGEKCMHLLSLILTINDESKSEFKLVLVDDLLDHLDAENIYNTFITLYNSTSSQIIVAGVQPYTYENADDIVLNIGD